MISNFWKKITIYNAALLIIFLRIYDPLRNYIEFNSENNSIFAKSGEDGFPFKESLNYNLDDINKITNSMVDKYKNNKYHIPYTEFTTNKCSFINKIEICKDSKECFDEINDIKERNFASHNEEGFNNTKIFNNEMIANLIQYSNQFIYEKNNMIEIPFYHEIIDGYSSYLSISSNDINIIKQVTQNENKMNNLLFLYSLYLKSYIVNDQTMNNLKINRFLDNENINNAISSLDNRKVDQLLIIINKILRENVFNCIPDLDMRYNYINDFQSIYNMLQILFKRNNKNLNVDMLNILFFKLTNRIKNIFILEEKIQEKSKIFCLIRKYFFYSYWCIAILIIYYCNKYFIRHKEFYKSKNRTIKNINANAEYKKYIKYQENIIKLQKKNRSKYTKEEIEMINKLTKDQKDYIISK